MYDPQNGTDNLIVCNLVDRLSQSSIFELYSKGLRGMGNVSRDVLLCLRKDEGMGGMGEWGMGDGGMGDGECRQRSRF